MKTTGRILEKGLLMVLAMLIGLKVAGAAPAPTPTPAPFKEIIAFGDSLTDVGNVALLTEPGYSPVIEGYYEESHFSDNVLWVEILAGYWGLPARTPGRGYGNKLSAKIRGNTWAWGGSEAGPGTAQPTGVTSPIPNLLKEIDQYLTYNIPARQTLYTIWSGADNLLVGGKFGPEAAEQAVDAVVKGMRRLERSGARHFLIFNLPKMGLTPDAQSGGEAAIAVANLYSDSFNAALDVAIEKLRNDRSFKGTIYFVDTYSLLVTVYDTVSGGGTYTPDFFVPGNPVAINNVTDMGLDYFDEQGTYPTGYLFWDDVHPTTQGHQVVAGLVLQAIEGASGN